MDKVRKIRLDSTLWATPSKLVNLLDFKPEKLSIETKSNTNNNIKVHNVRYENGGFYLTIDNIRGHFNFSNNDRILTMIFTNDEQQNKYHQVWKELFDVDLPIENVFKTPSITIVMRSLIAKNTLNHCLYEVNV